MKRSNIIKIIMPLIFILIILMISNVSATDEIIELNKSSLPYTDNLNLVIFGDVNSTVNIYYDSYLFGPEKITFSNESNNNESSNNKTSYNLNVTYEIPFDIENNNFKRNINLSNNNTYEIEFNIIDDIEFEMNVDEYYFINEKINIKFDAPLNTTINCNVTGEGTTFNSTIISSSLTTNMEFIPSKIGDYRIDSKFIYKDISDMKYDVFRVYEKLSCEIESTSRIFENDTIDFDVKIIGGIGSISYDWDFDDSTSSNIENPTHRFTTPGEYNIRLTITDSENYNTVCTKKIDVNEILYDVIFRLTDNKTGRSIGDANITFNDDLKKSNVNGIAKFYDISNGKYEIEIIKEDYDTFESDYIIETDRTINISLIKTPEDKKPVPVITLFYPQDDIIIKEETVKFDFTVYSDTNIKSCYLLVNEINNLGYKIKGTINELINDKKYSLSTKLTNGIYKWNMQCENSEGTSKSIDRYFTVSGVEVPVINQINDDDENAKQSSDESDSDNQYDVSDFDFAIEEINEFKKSIITSQSTTRELIELLAIDLKIEQSLSEIKKLKQNMLNLRGLTINENEKSYKKSEYLTKLNNLKATTPMKIILLNEKHYEINTHETDVTKAVDEYLEWKKIELSKSELKKYISSVEDVQDKLSVKTDLNIIRITYLNQNEVFKSIIRKEVKSDDINGGIFFELIPDDIVKTSKELTFSTQIENINDKPVIRIDTDQNSKFSYYINKNINIDDLMKINSVVLLDLNHPNNKITGFAILNTDSFSGKFFLIFILIGVVITSNYFIFYKDKGFREKIVNNIIQTKNSFKRKTKDEKLTQLLHNVMDLINEKNTNEAVSHYSKVLELYDDVNIKLQNDLKPIIGHLYYELEIYNLNKIIHSAYDKSLRGVWHEAVDEYNEIHDTLPDIPVKFKPKITKKLNKLDLTMNIHMLKSHTNINPDNSVDDSLYSKNNDENEK